MVIDDGGGYILQGSGGLRTGHQAIAQKRDIEIVIGKLFQHKRCAAFFFSNNVFVFGSHAGAAGIMLGLGQLDVGGKAGHVAEIEIVSALWFKIEAALAIHVVISAVR